MTEALVSLSVTFITVCIGLLGSHNTLNALHVLFTSVMCEYLIPFGFFNIKYSLRTNRSGT